MVGAPTETASQMLRPPGVPSNFASVALPVGEDLQSPHAAGTIDTDRVGDHVLAPEDLIDEHVTQQIAALQGLPGAQRPMGRLRAGKTCHRRLLRGTQRKDELIEAIRVTEQATLSGIDGHIVRGNCHLRRGGEESCQSRSGEKRYPGHGLP